MIWLVRIVGTMLALGLAGLSMAMTFSFGLAFAEGADRYIYAGAFAAMDGCKFLLPALAGYLAIQGWKKERRIARVGYLFFAFLSASSHVGLTLMVKDAEKSGATSSHSRLTDATALRDRLKGQVDALQATRTSAKIEADIAVVENDAIFREEKRSNRCTDDTAPASRTLCDRWRKLKGERGDRVELDRLTGDLGAAQGKVDILNSPGALKKANVLAATIAEKTDHDETTILLIIAIIMALGIEFGSSLMLELVTTAGQARKEEVPTITPLVETPVEPDAPEIVQIDAEPREAEPVMLVEDSRATLDPETWVQTRMEPRKGRNVPWLSTLELYKAEAEAQGMKAAKDNALSRALTNNGYIRKRPGGVTTIMGAGVKTAESVAKLKVVR